MSIDAWCVLCAKPLAYFNDGGWSHLSSKGLKVLHGHEPLPDRFVRIRKKAS